MKQTGNIKLAMLPAAFLCMALATPNLLAQQNDTSAQAKVQHALDAKRYGGVQVMVANGAVSLNGQVATLQDKLDAEKKAAKALHVDSVTDNLTIAAGDQVSDEVLREKLSRKLAYDRVGYGTTTFNAETLDVKNGVVTIAGLVVEPMDKDSALSIIESEKGVQGVVDHLQVAPLSGFDNRIRFQEARAIYGAPNLNNYAIDPAQPIRIAVENGHVTLVGVVDNQMDRNVAGIRVNGVPGVFSVTNDLQVAGQRE